MLSGKSHSLFCQGNKDFKQKVQVLEEQRRRISTELCMFLLNVYLQNLGTLTELQLRCWCLNYCHLSFHPVLYFYLPEMEKFCFFSILIC